MTTEEFKHLGDTPEEGVDYGKLWGILRKHLVDCVYEWMSEKPLKHEDLAQSYETIVLDMDKMVREAKKEKENAKL